MRTPQSSVDVLLVEDDAHDAEAVRRALRRDRRSAFRVVHVWDAETAVAELEKGTGEIVLTDLTLPDSDGRDTFATLHERCGARPIVVMTGNADDEIGAELVQAGAQDYLDKSSTGLASLARTLNHAIERARNENELRRARASALDGMRAKSEFLSSMSHEIRTPLNSVLGMADLLAETELTPEQSNYVGSLRTSGEALLDLINDILDLSKAEADAIVIDRREFCVRPLLEATMDVLAFSAHKKQLNLSWEVEPDVPQRVLGDPTRIRQVLVNLVGNAIKFTQQGEIHVHLDSSCKNDATEIHFQVRDTGVGVPKARQAAIFERFAQGDGSHSKRFGGTGLGLALCVELCRRMGGRTWVESDGETGSIFHFTIRVEDSAALGATDTLTNLAAGKRVLIADDNATERRVLRNQLERLGASVEETEHGRGAVADVERARAAGKPFDLVFLDCRMAPAGGFRVFDELCGDLPNVPEQYMMMLTTDHRPGDIERCEKSAPLTWMLKPLKPSLLEDWVREWLSASCPPPARRAAEPPTMRCHERPLRILLADDSDDNRALIAAYLKSSPHAVVPAHDGVEAVETFKGAQFDLVLMDIQMPVMDGYAATSAIRGIERSQGREPIPIIALTAYALPEERERSFDAGCDAHLTKPIRKPELLEAIAMHTGRSRVIVDVDVDIRDLVDGFLENRCADIAKLRVAIESEDFETVRILGHNMKGIGHNYGFDPISELGAELETAGRNLLGAEARKLTDTLEEYLDRVEVA